MRIARRLPSFRAERIYWAVRRALARATKADFRVVHFSVQSTHVHLVVEASDRLRFSRGMQGLAIRVARAVNRVLERRGSVWGDRYHRRDLETPREVRNALVYVLMNHRKHQAQAQAPRELDPYSSAAWFDGWSSRAGPLIVDLLMIEITRDATVASPVHQSETWLGRVGWKRRGLIEPEERPKV
jgi:putative transposase